MTVRRPEPEWHPQAPSHDCRAAAIFFWRWEPSLASPVLYLTSTPFRPLAHQVAEIVLFCLLFAMALFAVIAYLTAGAEHSDQLAKFTLACTAFGAAVNSTT